MRVKRIETVILRVPLGEERFHSSQCAFAERNSLLVKVETDEGLTGWGEGGQYGLAEPVAACIQHVLAPLVMGRDPREKGRLWHEMYSATRDFGQKGSYLEAISAIDIALWDLVGQALGEPVCALLGGAHRESVGAYATGCYYRGAEFRARGKGWEDLAQEARGLIDEGFGMLKMKVGLLGVEEDLERVAVVREAIGWERGLLVDANHAYHRASALRMAKGLERYGVGWFEEPVTPEDREGYRMLREAGHVAIAGGECEYTRYGFRDLIAGGCVDIVQPDICVAGGLSEWQKIVALAESYAIPVAPHVWGSAVALATALQAVMALAPTPHTANPVPLQNEPVLEYDRNRNPLRDELLETPIQMVEGRVSPPEGAGLGMEIREEVVAEYAGKRVCVER